MNKEALRKNTRDRIDHRKRLLLKATALGTAAVVVSPFFPEQAAAHEATPNALLKLDSLSEAQEASIINSVHNKFAADSELSGARVAFSLPQESTSAEDASDKSETLTEPEGPRLNELLRSPEKAVTFYVYLDKVPGLEIFSPLPIEVSISLNAIKEVNANGEIDEDAAVWMIYYATRGLRDQVADFCKLYKGTQILETARPRPLLTFCPDSATVAGRIVLCTQADDLSDYRFRASDTDFPTDDSRDRSMRVIDWINGEEAKHRPDDYQENIENPAHGHLHGGYMVGAPFKRDANFIEGTRQERSNTAMVAILRENDKVSVYDLATIMKDKTVIHEMAHMFAWAMLSQELIEVFQNKYPANDSYWNVETYASFIEMMVLLDRYLKYQKKNLGVKSLKEIFTRMGDGNEAYTSDLWHDLSSILSFYLLTPPHNTILPDMMSTLGHDNFPSYIIPIVILLTQYTDIQSLLTDETTGPLDHCITYFQGIATVARDGVLHDERKRPIDRVTRGVLSETLAICRESRNKNATTENGRVVVNELAALNDYLDGVLAFFVKTEIYFQQLMSTSDDCFKAAAATGLDYLSMILAEQGVERYMGFASRLVVDTNGLTIKDTASVATSTKYYDQTNPENEIRRPGEFFRVVVPYNGILNIPRYRDDQGRLRPLVKCFGYKFVPPTEVAAGDSNAADVRYKVQELQDGAYVGENTAFWCVWAYTKIDDVAYMKNADGTQPGDQLVGFEIKRIDTTNQLYIAQLYGSTQPAR